MTRAADVNVDSLLANAGWLRQLARCLANGQVEAEDLVQDTWLAALRSPPDPTRPARPWLAEVARNLVRMSWRTAARRPAGSSRDLAQVADETVPDELVERLQLQRQLATFVCDLDEPFRTTIMLRFYDGLPTATVAARLEVPAGTVRWRLSEGVRRLRARLDEADHGGKGRWRSLALWPSTDSVARRWPAAVAAVAGSGGLALVVAVALMAMAGRPSSNAKASAGPGEMQNTTPRGAARAGAAADQNAARMADLFGVVLPALVAAAADGPPYTREEQIADCLWHGARTFECQDGALDVMVNSMTRKWLAEKGPPGPGFEEIAKFRKKRQDQLVKFGTASIEDRRQRCEEDYDTNLQKGRPCGLPRSKDAQWHACFDQKDCPAATQCVQGLLLSWTPQ